MDNSDISNFYKEGYLISLENSKALSKVADQAAGSSEFGIATSLNILAAEEAIKSVAILTKFYFPEFENEHLKPIFSDHPIKHKNIIAFTFIIDFYIDTIYNAYLELQQEFKKIEFLPEVQKRAIKNNTPTLNRNINWILEQKSKKLSFNELFEWWNTANKEKNHGFYVDKKNNTWHNPRLISKESYEKGKTYTLNLIDYCEHLEHLYNDPALKGKIKTTVNIGNTD
jgi:AbiV family abortive infection protein